MCCEDCDDGYDDHLLFATCYWQKKRNPNIFYLGYRIFIAFYFALTFGMAFADLESEKRRTFMNNNFTMRCDAALTYIGHLTRATYFYILVQALLSLILISISVGYYLKKKEILNFERDSVKVLCWFYWIFNIIATDFIIPQQCFFWSWYYRSFEIYAMIYDDGGNIGKHIFVYGSNTVFLLIDFFMVAHPVKESQSWVPFVGHLPIIIVFVAFFFSKDYKICSELQTSVKYPLGKGIFGFFMASIMFFFTFCLVVAISVTLMHLCFWGLHKLKLHWRSPPSKSSSTDANTL